MKIVAISLGDMADKWDHLTPEQEGVASRVLRNIAAHHGQIPADDRGALHVRWGVRIWRLRVAALLKDSRLGFYVTADGMLRHASLDSDATNQRGAS